MTNIDQFESAFKSADKTLYVHEAVDIKSVLVVTDLSSPAGDELVGRLRSFLSVIEGDPTPEWRLVTGQDYTNLDELLALVQRAEPDLICTYRNLHAPAVEYPYSLGVFLDVLTQVTVVPILAIPHPMIEPRRADVMRHTRSVMAVTDHLTGDHRLVRFGVKFTQPNGSLYLTHVEDQATFDRYLNIVSKIPSIDTDPAREAIIEQLLKEPSDYIDSCRNVLQAEKLSLDVRQIVTLGHRLIDHRRLVQEHDIDLLILNTKDEDQLAMHGLAYPLSVELRQTPLLLL